MSISPEGNFGDTESDSSVFCGVYSTPESVEKAKEELPEPQTIDFGYGAETEEYVTIECTLDEIVEKKYW